MMINALTIFLTPKMGKTQNQIEDRLSQFSHESKQSIIRVAGSLKYYLKVYGSIWEYMGVYGSIWECTGVYGNMGVGVREFIDTPTHQLLPQTQTPTIS